MSDTPDISAVNFDLVNHHVSQIFRIEDIVYGTGKQKFLVKYGGRLLNADSEAAFDRLYNALKPMGLTPLFRVEDGRHIVKIIEGLPKGSQPNRLVNLVLFILTILSVLLTGALYSSEGRMPDSAMGWINLFITKGWPFAVSIIAILGTHELSHYFVGRYHGLNVTLPYFIPFPFSPFGTMGAFINMKDVPRNRKALIDVGVAGPLGGLVIAIPVLLIGLALSPLDTLSSDLPAGMSLQMEGNSLLYLLAKFVVFGEWLPKPVDFGNLSPLLYWIRYFFTGHPSPIGGTDVLLHSVAWAGWAGLLVTGLNLIPAGQLDGGHIWFVLFGEKASKIIYPIILAAMMVMGFFWQGWWLWALIIFFLGRFHAEPLDMITPIDGKRKVLGWIAVIVFILTFVPVPLLII